MELYARHSGCNRTLLGHFPEPGRRPVPPNTNPGDPAYDGIRPPLQRAGDSPPGPGQCSYRIGAALDFDDNADISDPDLLKWQPWATMEAKAQALVLGTVSPAIAALLTKLWSSHDMWVHLKTTYGTVTQHTRAAARSDLEALRLPENATAHEMFTHVTEFLRLNARATALGAPYQDWELSHRFVQSLAPPVTTDVYVLWTLLPPAEQTWDKLQTIYRRVLDARKYNPQSVNVLRQPLPPQTAQPKPLQSRLSVSTPAPSPSPTPRPTAKDYTPGATCTYCLRPNHTHDQCLHRQAGRPPRQRPPGRAPAGKENTATAATAAHVSGPTPPAEDPADWVGPAPPLWEDCFHLSTAEEPLPPDTTIASEPPAAFTVPAALFDPTIAPPPGPPPADAPAIAHISPLTTVVAFLLDSGSSANITHDRSLLVNVRTIPRVTFNHAGTTGSLSAIEVGCLPIKHNGVDILVPDVYHVPGARLHLLSVFRIRRSGWSTDLVSDELRGHGLTFPIRDVRLLAFTWLPVATPLPRPSVLTIHESEDNLLLAEHRRMGHMGVTKLLQLAKEGRLAYPFEVLTRYTLARTECTACGVTVVPTRRARTGHSPRGSASGEMVHADLTGITTAGIDGSRYALVLIADYTRVRAVFPIRTKQAADVLPFIQRFIARVETQCGVVVKTVRTDNGGEFLNAQSQSYYASRGINHQTSPAYSAEHNGVAERTVGTLKRMAGPMLAATPLGVAYWPFAMAQAVAILNMTTPSHMPATTAWQAITGRAPNLDHVLVFGTPVLVHVPLPQRADKSSFLPARSRLARYLGVHHTSTGILVRFEDTGEYGRTADYVAAPAFPLRHPLARPVRQTDKLAPTQISVADTAFPAIPNPLISTAISASSAPVLLATSESLPTPATPPAAERGPPRPGPPPRPAPPPAPAGPAERPRRVIRLPQRYRNEVLHHVDDTPRLSFLHSEMLLALSLQPSNGDPTSIRDAYARPDADAWRAAVQSEFDSLTAKGTWSEVSSVPPPHKPLGSKWVFKTKPAGTGPRQYRARLVAQGFSQQPGRDFEDTYAPVGRFSSLRVILALAAKHDLEVHVADVQSAYLNGNLDRPLYLRLPAGYTPTKPDTVALRLHKTLYGLRQSGHEWWRVLSSALASIGFKRIKSDWGVHILEQGGTIAMILLAYVDDMILVAKSTDLITQVVNKLHRLWPVKYLGPIAQVLGMTVTRNRQARTIHLSLADYIALIAKRFPADDDRAPQTPIPLSSAHMDPTSLSPSPVPLTRYQELTGCLGFVAHMARPDIEYAANWLGRFNHTPSAEHWALAIRLLAYLTATASSTLALGQVSSSPTLVVYSDASWNPAHSKGRSTSGYAAMLFGSTVTWASRRQDSPASSTMVAEYYAAAAATHEALWLRAMLTELGHPLESATPILIDNTSAIKLGSNPFAHAKSKHVELKYHIVREQVERANITLVKVDAANQAADCLTKPLSGPATKLAATKLGLQHT